MKVFSLTAMSTLVKMLTGFVCIKIIAVILGPEGLALMGQLTNFSTIIMAVACVGINNGVTKYIAEYKDDKSLFKNLVSTAYRITIIGSIVSGLFMICCSSILGQLLLKTDEYNYVFILFGTTIILYAMNNLLISIVNGLKEFKLFVRINIVNSIVGAAYTIFFVLTLGLKGAMISFVTYQSVALLITIFMLRRYEWFCWDTFKAKFSTPLARKYLQYTLMTFVSVSVVPVAQLVLRSYVIVNISQIEAGWWEAMNRLSTAYLTIITSSFGVYYLPRLSELKTNIELKREILKAYAVIIPALVVGFVVIYFLRFFVIKILFTPDFYPMENLFIWQLWGDLFKIASWLLAFLMLAKSRTMAFVTTEILFSALYVGSALFLIHLHGTVGLVQAYLMNYILYTITMVIIFRKILTTRLI
ncbi:MAG: O-antigen translocase [Alistipes sp.]